MSSVLPEQGTEACARGPGEGQGSQDPGEERSFIWPWARGPVTQAPCVQPLSDDGLPRGGWQPTTLWAA